MPFDKPVLANEYNQIPPEVRLPLLFKPAVRLYRAAGTPQDLYFGTGGSGADVPMTSTSFNDSTDYYTVASGKVTVLKAGLYFVDWSLRYDADGGSGLRDASIKINGLQRSESGIYTNNSVVIPHASTVFRLAANDVVGVTGYASAAAVVRSNLNDTGDVALTVAYLGT